MQPDSLPSDSPFRMAKLCRRWRCGWPQMRVQIIVEPQQIRVFPEMARHVVLNSCFHPVGQIPRQARPPTRLRGEQCPVDGDCKALVPHDIVDPAQSILKAVGEGSRIE